MENNSKCERSEQLVEYLYDEFDSASRIKFEEHLGDCKVCAEEITAFAAVRSGIGEWRDRLFEPISLPEFEPGAFSSNAAVITESAESGLFERFRKFIDAVPVWTAVPAMAILLIGFGVFYFSSAFQQTNSIAVNAPTDTGNFVPEAPQKMPVDAKTENEAVESESSAATLPEPKIEKAEIPSNPEKTIRPRKRSLKTAPAVVPDNSVKETPVQAVKEIPKLTNFTEYEDDSIRLSDLFDEVGSK